MQTTRMTIFSLAAAALLAGCNPLDPYAAHWRLFAVGDSRVTVESAMGTPSSVYAIEVPLVSVQQSAWRALSGRVYLVHFAMDRVLAKTVIE